MYVFRGIEILSSCDSPGNERDGTSEATEEQKGTAGE